MMLSTNGGGWVGGRRKMGNGKGRTKKIEKLPQFVEA